MPGNITHACIAACYNFQIPAWNMDMQTSLQNYVIR